MTAIDHIMFMTNVDFAYSRSSTYLSKDESSKVLIGGTLSEQLTQIKSILKKKNREKTTFVVMSPAHILVLLLKLAGAKKIILDAGWPLSDSTQKKFNINTIKTKLINLLIDLLAFKFSSKIILESPQQLEYVSKRFLVRKAKLKSIYTGISLERFHVNAVRPSNLPDTIQLKNFVLFRGKLNKEAGIEKIVTSFQQFQKIPYLVLATNKELDFQVSERIIVISTTLSDKEIAWLYKNSVATVGQYGSVGRLKRTIPHKFFESVWFGIPYITPKHQPIVDILGEDYPYWSDSFGDVILKTNFKYNEKTKSKINGEFLRSEFQKTLI